MDSGAYPSRHDARKGRLDLSDFEAMIRVPVEPFMERINHDLDVYAEEQSLIELAYNLSREEQIRYVELYQELLHLQHRYDRMKGYRRYYGYDYDDLIPSIHSALDSVAKKRDKNYLHKIKQLLIACQNASDGYVYIHDMKIYEIAGRFKVHPNILKIGMDDVETYKDRIEKAYEEIDTLKGKIEKLKEDRKEKEEEEEIPSPVEYTPEEQVNEKDMYPLIIGIIAILLIVISVKTFL